MSARSLHRRLDALASAEGSPRFIIQRVQLDGTAEPTEEEVEARAAEIEAAGFTPRLIRVRYVNQMPPGVDA